MSTSAQQSIDELNSNFDKLGKKFDNYFSQITKSAKSAIQKAISDWQDYYFSEDVYGKNISAPTKWVDIFDQTDSLLAQAIKAKNLKPKKPKETKVIKTVKVDDNFIFGKVSFKTLIAFLGTGVAIGTVGYLASKK